jgi:hypothetical protein
MDIWHVTRRVPSRRDQGAGVFRRAPAQPASAAASGTKLPVLQADLVHVHVPFTNHDDGGPRPGSVTIRPGDFVPPFAGRSDAAAAAAAAAYDALMRRPYDYRQVQGRVGKVWGGG